MCGPTAHPPGDISAQINKHGEQWMDSVLALGEQHQFSRAQMHHNPEHNRTKDRCGNGLRQAHNRKCVMRMQVYFVTMKQLASVRRCHRHQGRSLRILDKNRAGHRIILNNDSAIRPRKEAPLPQEVVGLVIGRCYLVEPGVVLSAWSLPAAPVATPVLQ
jgi:hypothetical protein